MCNYLGYVQLPPPAPLLDALRCTQLECEQSNVCPMNLTLSKAASLEHCFSSLHNQYLFDKLSLMTPDRVHFFTLSATS